MWPSQHEVSESLRTSNMDVHSEEKGFWIQYACSVLTGRCWTPEERVHIAADHKGQWPLAKLPCVMTSDRY